MSASRQKKIQEHYDTIADIYDHHYDKPPGTMLSYAYKHLYHECSPKRGKTP